MVARTHLLDVNVLIALAWPNHVHHTAAHRWFAHRGDDAAWATTPFTEAGFVRLCSNARAVDPALSAADALALLGSVREASGHRFVPDDIELVVGDARPPATHGDVTDAHLVAVALRHGHSLATFDRRLARRHGDPATTLIPT